MRQVSEPFLISEDASKTHHIPSINTPVPMIQGSYSVATLMSPSMGSTEKDAQNIYDFINTSSIIIIFNETDFELNINSDFIKENQVLLIIKPTLDGLYYVKEMDKLNSINIPFTKQQMISAQTIGFYISICLDGLISTKQEINDICTKRLDLINTLCKDPPIQELSMIATTKL